MRALLAAGGTGGHLFPAEALAAALVARSHEVDLVTDHRAEGLLAAFPARKIHVLPAATVTGRAPNALARTALTLSVALAQAAALVRRVRPDVAVGFGGYPTLAPLMATKAMGVPSIIHEANAVPGRANRRLAKGAHVATSFADVAGLQGARSVTRVGMPVRPKVRAAAAPYARPGEEFRLLVFGGSQGARAFADLVPPSLAKLGDPERARLRVTQQCRPEDVARVETAYAAAGIAAELAPFFADLPERMASSHLVIGRAGASTVAELTVIGRPSLLVPLPGAIDQDQSHNAAALERAGAAKRLDQAGLTPERLAAEIGLAMADPQALVRAAEAAARIAMPGAAENLADLCERVAKRR